MVFLLELLATLTPVVSNGTSLFCIYVTLSINWHIKLAHTQHGSMDGSVGSFIQTEIL